MRDGMLFSGEHIAPYIGRMRVAMFDAADEVIKGLAGRWMCNNWTVRYLSYWGDGRLHMCYGIGKTLFA